VSGPAGLLTVIEPGLLTTVQDSGRWGWQHLGVPVGGALDATAFRRANVLVGNRHDAAVLEATVIGPTLRLTPPLVIALTGADMEARLDDVTPLPMGRAVAVTQSAILRMSRARTGARAYLAVRGGLDTVVVLGSRSTTVGVLGGRPLKAGDRLPIGPQEPVALHEAIGPGDATGIVDPDGEPNGRLRVLPGPDVPVDDRRALQALCSGWYVVGAQSSRMGYRLDGAAIGLPAPERLSSGTVTGALQVPPDGQPILLMADRQTTGGYPMVAVVISADIPRAAQLGPGGRCRFEVCTRAEAVAALLRQEQALMRGGG
jgi:antagonist of KipI